MPTGVTLNTVVPIFEIAIRLSLLVKSHCVQKRLQKNIFYGSGLKRMRRWGKLKDIFKMRT
jgi:hypothetical protein